MSCGSVSISLGANTYTLPQYSHNNSSCPASSSSDPLNLFFENENASSLASILRGIANVDTNQNWTQPAFGPFATANNQWIDDSNNCVQQNEQLTTGPLWDRYHIRMWDLSKPYGIIAGAHHESFLTLGGNPPGSGGGRFPTSHPHLPSSHEAGKDSVCEDIRNNTGKQVYQNAIHLRNYKRVPYSSGHAAHIV